MKTILVSNGLSDWTKFYNSSSDRYGEESYKLETDKGTYQVLWNDIKRGKPYLVEFKHHNQGYYEELGFSATVEQGKKKCLNHYKTVKNSIKNPEISLSERRKLMSKRNRLFNQVLKTNDKNTWDEIDKIDARLNEIDSAIRLNRLKWQKGK